MFIPLDPNPNQTMYLQHMLEMGSLFSNACATLFTKFEATLWSTCMYTDAGNRRRNVVL
jgi:hypothetical protein